MLLLNVANLGKLGGDAVAQQSQSFGEEASTGYSEYWSKISNLQRSQTALPAASCWIYIQKQSFLQQLLRSIQNITCIKVTRHK
jgi:hypothetical protein